MNRIFSAFGEGWPGFPRRAFARLDQTEPVDPRECDEAVFAFDAIDASWPGFGTGGAFELQRHQEVRSTLSLFWTKMFGSRENRPSEGPFDDKPIYRIEVTSRRGDEFWDILNGFTKEEWITLQLGDHGSLPVDVYGGILAAAVEAFLLSANTASASEDVALSAEFDVDLWPDAQDAEIDKVLAGCGLVDSLVAYDVGQASRDHQPNGYLPSPVAEQSFSARVQIDIADKEDRERDRRNKANYDRDEIAGERRPQCEAEQTPKNKR